MPGERKTKTVAKRIDLSYIKQPSPLRTLRRTLVIVCTLAAVAWGGWAMLVRGERLYNPGPVAAVHAMFENNCEACHDGAGRKDSHFFKAVSDSACLKCHDGAIHAQKQVSLVSLKDNKPVMSSNCTACHVEHKGHAALAGTSDMLCTRCHDNLSAHVAGGTTAMQENVKTFAAPPAHPPFGRVLQHGGKWHDPTPLKFNHQKHLALANGKALDCVSCHKPSTTGNRRIMEPVSFEANCQECHPLTLSPELPDVPHQSMEIVRLFTAAIPASFSQKLAAMPPAEKEKALTITTEKRVGLRRVTEKKKVTEAEWLDAQTKELIDKKVAGSPAANQPAWAAIQSMEPAAKNAAALELYAAYGMSVSCSYCHTLEGNPAGVAKSTGDLLHTLPTGFSFSREIPATQPSAAPATGPVATAEGRRWFTGSLFDHDAHRQMACIDCHAQARSSSLTSDVLLPDIQSCTNCHHPGGAAKAAASNNCVTCHVYHDRSKETHPMK
jgi:predicted CXXCH cytochrome family protein